MRTAAVLTNVSAVRMNKPDRDGVSDPGDDGPSAPDSPGSGEVRLALEAATTAS